MLAVMKRLRPQHEFIPDFEIKDGDANKLLIRTDQSQSEALLRKWTGQETWKKIGQSIAENLESPPFPY